MSTANSVADGTVSCKSCSHFFPASKVRAVVPVMLAPGRFKLPTSPSATGSPAIKKTIGIEVVAALSASAAGGVVENKKGNPRTTHLQATAGRRAFVPLSQHKSI